MKKIKKKTKSEKVKYNQSSKITLIICISVVVLALVITILGSIFPKLQILYWEKIEIYYLSLKYIIGKLFIFRIGTFVISPFIILVITTIGLLLICDSLAQSNKITKEKKYTIVNKLRIPTFILLTVFSLNTLDNFCIEYNNPKIDTTYYESESIKEYDEQNLYNAFSYLENKVIELSKIQKRDSEGRIQYDEIENMAITDLKNISNEYKILRGYYPTKYYKFNDRDFEVDPSTYGLTSTDTIGINYYQEAPQLLNTITHELCHTRGIVRENEAVLCSVIAGIESDNELSNYAAYLEAYGRFSDAIGLIDIKKSRDSEERVFELCNNYNYQEICNIYRKDTKVYVKGSKSIEIQLFKIDKYDKAYLNELFNELDNYNMKLYIDDKKVTKEDISNPINKDKYLKIEIKNSKKIFSEIKDYLEENKQKFIYIFEIYDGMYEGVDMSREEAIKYYTSPIPNSNFITSFNRKEMLELFDYSRATRLIMEYLNHKNININ